MAEPSDWEPLPEAALVQRPGEAAELPRRAVLPAPVAPAPAVPPPPDPAAAAALAALQQRLATARPASSLLAQVAARERRQRRQQAAAVALQPLAPQQGGLPVEFDAGAAGRDPREDQDWFRALPLAERQRLQAQWASQRELGLGDAQGQRQQRNRRTIAALVVFAAVLLAGTGAYWHATVGAAVCCAIWWRHTAADRFTDPMKALGCLWMLHLLAFLASGSDAPPPGGFMDALLAVALSTLVGFDGEIRRSGGFDAVR